MDSLTHLPNVTVILDGLKQLLLVCNDFSQCSLAILFLDLEHFRLINEYWGELYGDRILQETVKRLLSCVNPSDLVARLGEDK